MDELELGRETYTTNDDLRTPSNFMKFYRELQILNGNYMNTFAIILPASQWLYVILSVYYIYGFIKLSGSISFFSFAAATNLVTVLVVLFTALAKLEVRSREVLLSWGCQGQSQILNRFVRSSKSIRSYIGTFYFVDHAMVLTMLQFIAESTVDLLVID
ncbi:unnamed protein product [Allacma fusca]|uniref:Uncharacterized protein n=1 Tax=Allacma fusca TaxID=39272 RepID=A0A8J2K3Z2_9HEXA|nr:unnamed protein product [Allacma fusca]